MSESHSTLEINLETSRRHVVTKQCFFGCQYITEACEDFADELEVQEAIYHEATKTFFASTRIKCESRARYILPGSVSRFGDGDDINFIFPGAKQKNKVWNDAIKEALDTPECMAILKQGWDLLSLHFVIKTPWDAWWHQTKREPLAI